jgi:formamidopyrimidine-DNA glycosylase
MPELPEVETITKQLGNMLAGKTIVGLSVLNGNSFTGRKEEVVGHKIISVTRRAKIAIIALDNDKFLLFHLKMTGQLIYVDHKQRVAGGHADHDWHAELPNSHTRIIFDFGNEEKLYFNDMRKFGWCRVLNKNVLDAFLAGYGPEPLSSAFTPEYLKSRADRMKKIVIKKFLMDQSIVAGIGNIYADETLYAAKIHPLRPVGTISDLEWQRVVKESKRILAFAITKGGTTDSDYVNAYGKKGGMQDFLKVYHHAGEPCPSGCGGKIEKIVVGGRGTHFCPACQKEKV